MSAYLVDPGDVGASELVCISVLERVVGVDGWRCYVGGELVRESVEEVVC